MSSRGDISVAIAFVLLGIAIVIGSAQIPSGSVQDPIGTGGMPRAMGIVIIVLGTSIAVRRGVQLRRTGEAVVEPDGATDEPEHPVNPWRPLIVWGLAVIYVISLPRLGYLLLTPLLAAALLWLMGVRDWWTVIGVPLGFTLTAFALFQLFLRVALP